jgi:3',5'-cyclic AMP phosphodiesterase CpdA
MKLVVFSDLHYAPTPPIENGSIIGHKLTEFALPILNNLINEINENIKPDVVINCGDLIEDFNDREMDLKNLEFLWDKLKGINAPFYSLIGNHDLRAMETRADIENIFGYKNATFSIDLNGYHLVFLAPQIDDTKGDECGGILRISAVSDEELDWLENDILNTQLPTLVFVHYGLAEDEMIGNWWFAKNPTRALLKNRDAVKEIISKSENVKAVFSGHQHWSKKIVENGLPYYVIGSITEDIKEDGVPDGCYYIVDIDERGLRVEEKHIAINQEMTKHNNPALYVR